MRMPIRMRLAAVYCVIFSCSTLLLGISAYWGISAAIYAIVDHDLRARLAGVEGFLNDHAGKKSLPRLQEELRNHEALQPAYLSIAETAGSPIFRGSVFQGLSAASTATKLVPGGDVVWTAKGNPEWIRILAVCRTIRGRDYDLLLATGLTVPFEILSRARLVLLLTGPLILLCALRAGYWIAGRALAPVSELIRTARSIGAAELTRRIVVPQGGDEIQELAVTLNEMLVRIDNTFRQVTQFTANASHELRTPLALIRTTSEVALLRKSASAATYREALHRVLAEAERNTALLDHLLFLARADSGQILTKRPVDIGQEIKRTCEQVQVLAAEKDLSLRVDTDDDPMWISGNPDHLRRLWLVLLDNAVKYTSAAGEVTVSVKASDADSVSVEVTDTGIGIAEEDLPHIFERFFRADEARTKGVGGSGLGLSIARWVAEAHDATIGVRSVTGQGSVFRVVFPRLAGFSDAVPSGVDSLTGISL
jgi:heavy metal sensor kinase